MAGLGPRAAVTLPAAAALALLLSFLLLKRRRSRANSECRSLSATTACLRGDNEQPQRQCSPDHLPTSAGDKPVLAVVVAAVESPDMRLRDAGKMGDVKLKGPAKGSRCSSATKSGALKAPCANSSSSSSSARVSECSPPAPQQPVARQRQQQQQDSADVVIAAATAPVTTAVREKSSPPCAVLTVEIPEQSASGGDQRPAASDDGSPPPVVGGDAVCGATSPSGSVDSLLGQSSSPPSSTVSPARRESASESASPSLAQDVAALSLAEQQSTPAKEPEAVEEPVASSAASTTASSAEASQPPTSTEHDGASSRADVLQNDESVSEDRSQAQALSFSDAHSEGSSDSGKGGSDIHGGSEAAGGAGNLSPEEELPRTYEFELPRELCGRFIGQGGRNVTAIKSRSNTRIYVHQHPFTSKLKICSIEGTPEEIRTALELIRKKFPLHAFPNLTLAQVNAEPLHYPGTITLPETLQLRLPDGVTCDVVLTSLVTAGHFFLQQPTHPTYPSLARLDQFMLACYGQGLDTPPLPHPVEAGIICAAQVCGGWFRALVVAPSDENEECDIKFLDYGGYMTLSTSLLRQIRSDFMMLPFQASECYLANVQPAEDDNVWSAEACATFEDLAQGQILQALIVGYADNGIPLVHLYRVQGVSSVFINRELVNRGVARWLEHPL
ncbi:A-kinase anchor protein spoonbill isoform X1 [Amblyomma americanum]